MQRIRRQIGVFFLCIVLFGFGVKNAEAAPIMILNNSRHAYGNITSTLTQLLGGSYTASQFVVHSTASPTNGSCPSDATFSGSTPLPAIQNTGYVYCDQSGATTTPQFPYQIFSTSFTGNPGDSVSVYNQFASYDLTDDYAFTATPNLNGQVVSASPPTFYTAPGGGGWASAPGVEWTIDPNTFCVSTLSCLTAANTGIMAWLRLEHPTWNWFDVKAAMRQNGTNWTTGYNSSTYGFGVVNATTTNQLADNQILLQPPEVATSTTGSYNQLTFSLFPFRQTRRAKEVLFEFPTNPGTLLGTGGNSDITLAQIQTAGGTKVTDYSDALATTSTPIYTSFSNKYFSWLTADNANDTASTTLFSRIDTYSIFGPLSQPDIIFSGSFDLAAPANNAISSSTEPTFSWSAASSHYSISKYQLYVDGTLNVDNIASTSTSVVPTTPLSTGTHTWYIDAVNGTGTATTSVSTWIINVLPNYTASTTFYVDNVLGSDNNPGSQAQPWATLTKASNTVQAGNTVIVIKNAGTPYRDMVKPVHAGTASAPITFEGVDAQNKPEIWGSDDVSGGWSVYSGGNPDTYQKSITISPDILYAGPSSTDITKRVFGSSATALNPGEWYSYSTLSSNTLYYRLNASEDIATLHVEVGDRNFGLTSNQSYTVFKNFITRYSNDVGVHVGGSTGSIAENVEAYDSAYTGISMGSNTIVEDSVAAGNGSYGIWSQYGNDLGIYNSLAYDNGTSGVDYDVINGGSVATIENNISAGNPTYSFSSHYYFTTPTITASNNNWDIPGDSHWDTFKGTNNQELVDSLFTSTSTRDFSLTQFSPDIDTGTVIAGAPTTDILGNPIYGTPDIGPYEYQPPYSMGMDSVPVTGSIRVYENGKYRMLTATSSTRTANLTVTPMGGFPTGVYSQWLDVAINTWNTSGDYAKSWTETGGDATSVVHTVGDLAANTKYDVTVDGAAYATATTDAGGTLSFTYTGGYTGGHTFAISAVAAGSISVPSGSSGGSSNPLPPTTTTVATTAATSTASVPASSAPTLSVHASGLTSAQVTSILSVLESFGVDSATVANIETILTGAASAPSSSIPSACVFMRDLTIGSKGSDVTCLQQALIKKGYAIPDGATGYFGLETQTAVASWQRATGVAPARGYFGVVSRRGWE